MQTLNTFILNFYLKHDMLNIKKLALVNCANGIIGLLGVWKKSHSRQENPICQAIYQYQIQSLS